MTKFLKGSLVAFALLGFTGCVSTSDIKVESTKSDKVDLKGYKTYQFIEGSGILQNGRKKKVNAAEEIEAQINSELMKKGKVPVSKDPDFFVAYMGGSDMDAVKKKLDKNGKEIIEKSPEAALVLMLVDADSGSIIWMSTAEGEARGGTKDEIKKRIDYAVKQMLNGVK